MSPQDEADNCYYEKLYEAIMRAITSSDEVKEILQDLQAADKIDSMAVMNVILSLEELSEIIQSGATPKGRKSAGFPSRELKEALGENFDEVQWLKKVGIRL